MITLQKMTVNEVYNSNFNPLLLVGSNEQLSLVIKRFSNHPDLRGMFVVDEQQHLLGVVTRTDLLDWARVKFGGMFHAPRPDLDKSIRLINVMRASTAGEFVHPNSYKAAVSTDVSLAQALRVMIELDLILLPVVTKTNQIIGDIKLSDLLARIIQEEQPDA